MTRDNMHRQVKCLENKIKQTEKELEELKKEKEEKEKLANEYDGDFLNVMNEL